MARVVLVMAPIPEHWVPVEAPYCSVCWAPDVPTFETAMYDAGQAVCEGCRDYEDLYLSWTEEERRADQKAADQYGNEVDRG